MQKFTLLGLSFIAIAALSAGLSSCKDDDEPAVNAKLSFAEEEITVNENEGTIEIEVVLDKAAPADITVEYEVSGTATEGTTADYEIAGSFGELEIEQGATSGVIEIEINNDLFFEANETIELSLEDVSSDAVDITNDDEVVITIDDDDVAAKVSFTNATATLNESDGLVEIQLTLDQPAPGDITVEYSIAGTARDSVTAVSANPVLPHDYAIQDGSFDAIIPQGATTGVIEMVVKSDFAFENDETIIFQITGASDGVTIGTTNKTTITVEQQDGRGIELGWDEAYTNVDMDMFLWIGETPDELEGVIASSIRASFDPPELIFIPDIFADAAFGVSYVYYEGTQEPMNFTVSFIDFADGEVEDEAGWDVFDATYTLANINPWDQASGVDPIVVQTFQIVDGAYTNLSDIDVPAENSRVKAPGKLPMGLRRHAARLSLPMGK